MVHSLLRPYPTVALLDDEPEVVPSVMCPMCHTEASLTQSALEAGGSWRCVRCGQHWDAGRLTAVAAYAVWIADRARADSPSTERSPKAAQYRNVRAERLDGTP